MSSNGVVQSADRFADRFDDLYGVGNAFPCFAMIANGCVPSADRFANRFDDPCGFVLFFNDFYNFQWCCTICWQRC